jgi:hypothetical protein
MKKLLLFFIVMAAIQANAQVKVEKKIVSPVVKPVKKAPVMVVSAPLKLAKPLKITSHHDGQDAYGGIQILGTGEPGLAITVSLYAYAEVTPKKNNSLWQTFKNITIPTETYGAIKDAINAKMGTQVKERGFNNYKVTIDKNGKWYIPMFMSFGSTDWMRNAFIPFAWVVVATSTDPNYRQGNFDKIRLGCPPKS